ncbi:MAG: YjjG family noncanonical pyrimidine nucleotidase [Clostridia bacterium]|nr:YjjG family noncanonical pyrimidine nucleotidase [Clostridia bacterium]
MIKAVILDVDNTLLDFNLSAKATIKAAFRDMGLTFSDQVFRTFLRVNDGLWLKIERKEITREELHATRWNIIFRELGEEADGLLTERLFLKYLEEYAIPVDGAVDLVKYLSAKYAVYTASNAPYLQQVKRLTVSGIMPYISKILSFENAGVHKPQKRFFEECLKAILPATAAETAIAGDSLSADMKGGKDVGFTTVWFNRGDKSEKPAFCDYVVKNLAEIKNIL